MSNHQLRDEIAEIIREESSGGFGYLMSNDLDQVSGDGDLFPREIANKLINHFDIKEKLSD